VGDAPIEIKARGKKLLTWQIDQNGLTSELPIPENRKFASVRKL
jgi:hypothetical protein